MFHNSSNILSSTTTGSAISSLGIEIYYAFFAVGFQGAIREARIWKGAMSKPWIESYLFQAVDTTEMLTSATPPLFYFPFNSESEVSEFQSGLTSASPATAKLIKSSDYTKIGYAALSSELIICPVGQIYINTVCIAPTFELRVVDLYTDYNISLVSTIPSDSSAFTYTWQYPTLSSSDSEVSTYLNAKITGITNNYFTIFKPALKSSLSATFLISIVPSIYEQYFGTITLTKTVALSSAIGCPVATLSTPTIELSNLNTTTVNVVLSLSTCSVAYTITSVEWSLLNGVSGVTYFTVGSSNTVQASISAVDFGNYNLNTAYTLNCTAKISMTSASGEDLFSVVSATATIVRHEYRLLFSAFGSLSIPSYDTLTLQTAFNVTRDGAYLSPSDPISYSYSCPSVMSSVCGYLPIGFSLTPSDRIQYNIPSGSYSIGLTGTWKSLTSTQSLILTITPSSPAIRRNPATSLFYDYVVYELVPGSSSPICDMSGIDYHWHNTTLYPATLLSDRYELKVPKSAFSPASNKILAELLCDATGRTFYDFVVPSDSASSVVDLDRLKANVQYTVTPLQDPIVIDLTDAVADVAKA